MEMYFIKSAACLAVLLLFYKLLLERENMHVFKRFYLLTSVVAAIVIPMITFTTYIEPSSGNFGSVFLTSSEEISANSIAFSEYLPFIFWSVYFIGILFFSIKFIRNLKDLFDRIKKNPQIKRNCFTNVLLSQKISPHTFFNYIFLNKSKYEKQKIPREVLVHEEAHAIQKHSIDILLVELFQIIFWFNPFIFLQKKAIKLNHEFLADRAVIRKGFSTSHYQQTLLSFSSGDLQSDLVNPINYSSIKKRFTVMKTQTSKTVIWGKTLLLIPLFVGLIYSCSNKEELEVPTEENALENSSQEIVTPEMLNQYNSIARKYNSQENLGVKVDDYEEMRQIYDRMSPEQKKAAENLPKVEIIEVIEVVEDAEGKSATPEMVAEYNKLAQMYFAKGVTTANVEDEEFKRLFYIYGIMTPGQRENAEKLPPPPPPPPAPKPEMNEENVLPPPPPPPSYEDLVEKGAIFYYNGKEIKPEEARKLVEVEKRVNVQITEIDGKTEVRLTDKEK